MPRVEFPIRTVSWRRRIDTTYNYNDVKDKIRVADKRVRALMLKCEWLLLQELGFDVREELRFELREHEAMAKRAGRELCAAYPRLKKLIHKL